MGDSFLARRMQPDSLSPEARSLPMDKTKNHESRAVGLVWCIAISVASIAWLVYLYGHNLDDEGRARTAWVSMMSMLGVLIPPFLLWGLLPGGHPLSAAHTSPRTDSGDRDA